MDEQVDDGFSSDQQFKHEEIVVIAKKPEQSFIKIKESVKLLIPPAIETKRKAEPLSLQPDMVTGWVPRMLLHNPVPILYQRVKSDKIIRHLLKPSQQTGYSICYLGPRYQNTYFMHYGKPYNFPYNHIRLPSKIKKTDRAFCGQNSSVEDSLIFDSDFESGNLDCAVKVSQNQYDLFILFDTNTRGHTQWYNFKIRGMKKNLKYKFTICNFQKQKSLYSRGMRPYIQSQKKLLLKRIGFEQAGQNLKYDNQALRYKFLSENDCSLCFKLSFEYSTEFQEDQIQMAYCIPYEYSTLLKYVDNLVKQTDTRKENFLNVDKLCFSLGGLQIPLLTIHEDEKLKQRTISKTSKHLQFSFESNLEEQIQPKISKKCIIITGRTHPGESNGSFMMQGFLDFICGLSNEAAYLRKKVIFKIIPMLNPDGVVSGNYRTGLSGKDFNRQFIRPDQFVFPEVRALKSLVQKYRKQYKESLLLFLDFHGHSIKKNVFMYGPEFNITEKHYYQTKIFPKLLGLSTDMFRFHSCIFRISQCKNHTARAVLLRQLDVPFTFTVEASNGSYYDTKTLKDKPFNSKLWIQMGLKIGTTIYGYCNGLISAEQIRIIKQRQKLEIEKRKRKGRHYSKTKKNPKSPKKLFDETFTVKSVKTIKKHKDQNDYSQFQSLIDEIKKQMQNPEKQKDKLSDDNLSQGSSDQQKQIDDLNVEKLKKIHTIIKNKNIDDIQKLDFQMQEDIQSKSVLDQPIIALQNELDLVDLPPIDHINSQRTKQTLKQKMSVSKIQRFNQYYKLVQTPKSLMKVSNISLLNSPVNYSLTKSTQKNNSDRVAIVYERKPSQQGHPHYITNLIDHLQKTVYIAPKQKLHISPFTHNLTFYQKKPRQEDLNLSSNLARLLQTDRRSLLASPLHIRK